VTFLSVHPFLSFNLAVVLLILGKILTLNLDLLRRYSIPEPVAGGFLCIAVTGGLWGGLRSARRVRGRNP
jgi:ESS family glutamate:Na+ symporter